MRQRRWITFGRCSVFAGGRREVARRTLVGELRVQRDRRWLV